jgi:2-keto-4-pentenoate hydratase
VTTGSMTGLMWTEPGSEMSADFPGLGRVEVSFPA